MECDLYAERERGVGAGMGEGGGPLLSFLETTAMPATVQRNRDVGRITFSMGGGGGGIRNS